MEEAAIIRALQAGDRSALEEAVVRYTHYLTAVAARAMGPAPGREDLEEIVSDTFLSLWRFRANLDPERPLRPWLAVAARNLAVSRLRQRKETQEIPETLPDSRPGPEELAQRQALHQHLRALVEDMSEPDRTQLGGTNDRFETVVDLSQVESIIYGYTEFPMDGSPSLPADLPENLYPFTCTEIILDEYHVFRFPVEELYQKLRADYQWDEATQTATTTYRGVTLTMTVGQSCYQRNGETVELLPKVLYDSLDPDSNYVEYPQYISLEDGVLTAPVNLLEDWSLDYLDLRTQNGEPAGLLLIIP